MYEFTCNIGETVDVEYIIDRDNCINIEAVTINGHSVIGLLSNKQFDDLENEAFKYHVINGFEWRKIID